MKRSRTVAVAVRTTETAKGLFAIVLIAGFLFGLPYALVKGFGSPLPSITDAVDAGLSDTMRVSAGVFAAAVITAWFLWSQIAFALLAELVTARRGKPSVRATIVPGVQTFARRVVRTSTLLAGAIAPATLSVTPALGLAPTAADLPAPIVVEHDITTGQDKVDHYPTIVTQPGEGLWDIAGTVTGDNTRWRQILALNVGTTMANGEELQTNTEYLPPGTVLRVPTDADVTERAIPPLTGPEATGQGSAQGLQVPYLHPHPPTDPATEAAGLPLKPYEVQKGDYLYAIAERYTGDGDNWVQIWNDSKDLNQNTSSNDPNKIYPAWVVMIRTNTEVPTPTADSMQRVLGPNYQPPTGTINPPSLEVAESSIDVEPLPEPVGSGQQLTPTPMAANEPLAPNPPVQAPIPATQTPVPVEAVIPAETTSVSPIPTLSRPWTLSAALVTAGIGSAGLAGFVLSRIRRRRLQHAATTPAGQKRKAPGDGLAVSEASLHVVADDNPADLWTHRAFASLSAIGLHTNAVPVLARGTETHLEVLFSGSVTDVDEPWELIDNKHQRLVRIDRDTDLTSWSQLDAYTPLPVMCAIGQLTWINLEHAGLISLTGTDPETTSDLVRHIMHELSASPATNLRVRTTVAIAGTDQYDKLATITADELVDAIADVVHNATNPDTSTFAARSLDPATVGVGLVGFMSAVDYDALNPDLAAAIQQPHVPVALLVFGSVPDTTCRFDLQRNKVVIEPQMLRDTPVRLNIEAASANADLLYNAQNAPAESVLIRSQPTPGYEPVEFAVPVPQVTFDPTTQPTPASPSPDPAVTLPDNEHDLHDPEPPGGRPPVGASVIDLTTREAIHEIEPSEMQTFETGPELDQTTESHEAELPAQEVLPANDWQPSVDEPESTTADDVVIDLDEDQTDEPLPMSTSSYTDVDLLRILGPIELATARPLKPQELAVAAFLVVSGGATIDEILTHVWDGRIDKKDRAVNVASSLRNKLGGERVLPKTSAGRPYVVNGITTDAAILEQNVAQAQRVVDDYDTQVKFLVDGLSMVRGPVLTKPGLSSQWWKWVEFRTEFQSNVEAVVRLAATMLAELSFDAEDYEVTEWAGERGSLAAPTDEHLAEWIVKAHIARNRMEAAKRSVDAYEYRFETLGCGQAPTGPREIFNRASSHTQTTTTAVQ